ncbi:MAG: hypothetical protein GX851_00395 [Clostridiales bacterium]|nr:hypothetical protein [Clostridiales bacterium]
MPYIIEDGEKLFVAIGLEHLKVTDPLLIEELNSSLSSAKKAEGTKAVPSSYFNLIAASPSQNSIEYNQEVSLTPGTGE